MKLARRLGMTSLLLWAAAYGLGCDATAILYTNQVQWNGLYVMSSVPMIEGEGTGAYEPLCRSESQDPVGILFNVLFQGTSKKEDTSENDLSIRPGDYVDNQFIEAQKVTSELFTLAVTCMERSPDDNLSTCAPGSVTGDKLPIQSVEYITPGRTNPDKDNVAVAIVMDMSGSMKGLVIPRPPYNEEAFVVVTQQMIPDQPFDQFATDSGSARFNAVNNMIDSLNDKDPMIMFSFNDQAINVVCELPSDPDAGNTTKKEQCFSTNRSLVFGGPSTLSAFDALKGEEQGRSPLWSAVYDVYDYMKKTPASVNAGFRHIVVITDGPDTCATSADMSACTGNCPFSVSFEEARSLVEADVVEDRIPIHFVQLQAKGYKDRDPLQQEMACLTGGHYMYLNMLDIPQSFRQDILARILERVRYTFRGQWQMAVSHGALRKKSAPDCGYNYVLEGNGQVLPGTETLLLNEPDSFSFKVNDDDIAATNWADLRVSVRKECDPSSKDTCEGEEDAGACAERKWWCDAQSLVCRSALEWTPNGDKGKCKAMAAEISVTLKSGPSESQKVDYQSVSLGEVPTVCCGSFCTPPRPPVIPQDINQPQGSQKLCLRYDEQFGWRQKNPDDLDSAWVYYATFNQSELCSWNEIKKYVAYENVGDLEFPADWDCSAQNCFPPPAE